MKPINTKQRNIAFWTYASLLLVTFLIFGFSVYIYAHTPVVEKKNLESQLYEQEKIFGEISHLQRKIDTINSSFKRLDIIDIAYKDARRENKVEDMAIKQNEYEDLLRRLNGDIARDFQLDKEDEDFDNVENIRKETGLLYKRLLSKYKVIFALRDQELGNVEDANEWQARHDVAVERFKKEEEIKLKLEESLDKTKSDAEKIIYDLEDKWLECEKGKGNLGQKEIEEKKKRRSIIPWKRNQEETNQ